MRQNLAIAFIILFCTLVSTYDYMVHHFTFCTECQHIVIEQSDSILTGSAVFPFIYRVLTPFILNLMGGSIFAVAVFHFIMRGLTLSLLYIWVDHWDGNALASVGLMTVVFSIMGYTWYSSPHALTEGVLLLLGWLLLVSKRLMTIHYITFGCLIILGGLNRETTGFLLLLSWLILHYKKYKLSTLYIMLAVGVFLYLRFSIGFMSANYSIGDVLQWNLTQWRLNGAIFYNGILFTFWISIILYSRSMPTEYKRLLLTLFPYSILFLMFGVWQEIRLLIPVALILFPLIPRPTKADVMYRSLQD